MAAQRSHAEPNPHTWTRMSTWVAWPEKRTGCAPPHVFPASYRMRRYMHAFDWPLVSALVAPPPS
jgi:hypothetical protein